MSDGAVVQVPFLGCALSTDTDVTPVLDVTCFDGYLRGPDGLCAFCHGDPYAGKPCADCGGGCIIEVKPGEKADPYLPSKLYLGKYVIQHLPHAGFCTRVTWIDRELWAGPEHFAACPCCKGQPA